MLKPWSSELRSVSIIAAVSISALGLGAAALAAPKPMELAALYDNSISPDIKLPKNPKACSISLTSVTDERRSPEMIGVFLGRAVRAPADRDAWLRSIVSSLKSRKISVNFAKGGAELAAPLAADVAQVAVTKAWIANTDGNMSASIVFRLKSASATGIVTEQIYRGGASHSSYFSGGPGELQRAFDTAVARALDAMATDIQIRCGNSLT